MLKSKSVRMEQFPLLFSHSFNWLYLRRRVDGKLLTRFSSENSVYKFLRASVDGKHLSRFSSETSVSNSFGVVKTWLKCTIAFTPTPQSYDHALSRNDLVVHNRQNCANYIEQKCFFYYSPHFSLFYLYIFLYSMHFYILFSFS